MSQIVVSDCGYATRTLLPIFTPLYVQPQTWILNLLQNTGGTATGTADNSLYHANITGFGNGLLKRAVAPSTVYLQMNLNSPDLESYLTYDFDANNFILAVEGIVYGSAFGVCVFSDGIYLFSNTTDAGFFIGQAITGNESIVVKFESIGAAAVWVDGAKVYSDSFAVGWSNNLAAWWATLEALGSFEAWITSDGNISPQALVNGENSLNPGAVASVLAVPDATHVFSMWLKDGVDGGTENPAAITNPENVFYHAIATRETSGNLAESIPVGSRVFLQLNLAVSWGNNVIFAANDIGESANGVYLAVFPDGIQLASYYNSGISYLHLYETAVAGTEKIKAEFGSSGQINLWINDALVYSELSGSSFYAVPLTEYAAYFNGEVTGGFEAWITTDGNISEYTSRSIQPVFTFSPVTPTSLIGVCLPAKFGVAKFGYSKFGNYLPLAENDLIPKLLAATPPSFDDLKNKLKTRR